jgi:hypothetical protein
MGSPLLCIHQSAAFFHFAYPAADAKTRGDRHIRETTTRITNSHISLAIAEADMKKGVVLTEAWMRIAIGRLPLVRLKAAVGRIEMGMSPKAWNNTPNGPLP